MILLFLLSLIVGLLWILAGLALLIYAANRDAAQVEQSSKPPAVVVIVRVDQ